MDFLSVYDHKGEMFEVRPDKAKMLVIEHGWSLEPPKMTVPVAPVIEKAPEPVAPAHGL